MTSRRAKTYAKHESSRSRSAHRASIISELMAARHAAVAGFRQNERARSEPTTPFPPILDNLRTALENVEILVHHTF